VDWAAWAVPAALIAALVASLAVFVPRWRRPGPATAAALGPTLDAADARRLDEDLARYEP